MWHISLDVSNGKSPDTKFWREIEQHTKAFEQQFSRFLPNSEVNSWKEVVEPGQAKVSEELATLLDFAQKLKQFTKGGFNPAVGQLLETAGYNATYTFTPQDTKTWQAPDWSIEGRILNFSSSLVFDLGGYGKGYWIDKLSTFLLEHDYQHHLIDGGGDMFGTTKQNGDGWRVGIEFPGESEKILDVVVLINQALAVSDTYKRRWGDWHHILDPRTKQATNTLKSCAVIAETAIVADALTTCLMVSPRDLWPVFHDNFAFAALMIDPNNHPIFSGHWRGEILTSYS